MTGMEQLERLSKARHLTDGEGRRLRVAARVSARELAAVLGISTETLMRWETGDTRPQQINALAWLDALERLKEIAE